MIARVVADEALDHLAADDPAAQRSRRDLQRVHLAMGTRGIVARALQRALDGRASRAAAQAPLRVLEIGAGDGSLMLAVAQRLGAAWPRVALTLLDQQALVTPATVQRFAALGWTAQAQVGDVMAWAAEDDSGAAAGQAPSGAGAAAWDCIVATLFLHHFEGPDLAALLAAVARRATSFVACEPRRSALALAGSHLVGALGVNAVTRADAVLSVHAGFSGHDITAAWPREPRGWALYERAAGLFSHLVVARRVPG